MFWTLIIFTWYSHTVAVTTLPAFTDQSTCDTAGAAAKLAGSGAFTSVRYTCVRVQR